MKLINASSVSSKVLNDDVLRSLEGRMIRLERKVDSLAKKEENE